MYFFSRRTIRELYYILLFYLSNPLLLSIIALIPRYKFGNTKALMIVHIANGLPDYKLHSILAPLGLLLIIISWILFRRTTDKIPSIINLTGCLCLIIAVKIVQMDDESNYMTGNFYNALTSAAFATSAGLFIAYNCVAWIKWNVKKFVEDIWVEEQRKKLN